MSPDNIVTIVVALLAGSGGLFSYLRAMRAMNTANENARNKVDSEAFKRAQDIYTDALANLTMQVRELRALIDTEQETSNELRTRVRHLEDVIYKLRQELRNNDIPIPGYLEAL